VRRGRKKGGDGKERGDRINRYFWVENTKEGLQSSGLPGAEGYDIKIEN